MSRQLRGRAFSFVLCVCLSGCGVYAPQYQEFWGNSDDARDKVKLIIKKTECELKRAFQIVEIEDIQASKLVGYRSMKFLEDWELDATFIFTVEEKSTINPGVSLNDPMRNATTFVAGNSVAASTLSTTQSYTFGIGGQFSSDGYRQRKVHIPLKIGSLIGPEKNLPPLNALINQDCTQSNASATLFIDGDLHIDEWVKEIRDIQVREQADFTQKNAFASNGAATEDIKFEIVTTGNLTPTWKLVRVSANSNSPLFNATRDRTQEILITMGPVDKQGQLKGAAHSARQSSEFAASTHARN